MTRAGATTGLAATCASLLALTSCGNTTDCAVRRDCPSDLIAGASGTSGQSGNGGTSGYRMEPVVDAMSALSAGTGGTQGVGGTYGDPTTKAPDGTPGLVKDKYKVP